MTNPMFTKPLLAYLEAGEIEIRTGPFGTQLKASEYVDEGTPVINVRNIGFGSLRPEKLEFVPENVESRLQQHRLRTGDIVFGRKGAVERHLLVKADQSGWIQGSDCIRVRIISGSLNPRFLSYCLLLEEHQNWIQSQASHGATMATLNQGIIERIRVPERTTSEQQRIVDILSGYDDLIDVNQRRVSIQEDMARRLFDEWFVRFRYPGHETVPLIEAELGMAPEGWKPGTIADLSSFIGRGLAPKYDDEASSLVINQKCIRDQALNLSPARKQSKPIPQSKLVIDGDILINSTGVGTLGRVAQLLGTLPNTTVDTHVTIVRVAEQVDLHYFGLQLLQLQPHFERQGIGATGQTELSKTVIADTKIIIPPSDLASRFGRIAGPLRCQAELLRNQNNKLRTARDLLLPKLISGKIDLSSAEKTFAEAAE
ncbi:restriction endonuclease subunit S [Rhizobium ruizarguesonis]|nr:restriction endonuclease subunit S [Rhizobium ruizarguesonis]TAW67263.1 restriction endonuclease subunit S [Rhizobium ruizarguesonis]TAW91406.1 restriction endonuclease subunit S [Rhizobium ruizarguesonis]TAZ59297.1 restriction endonuclease subunit S [Rhizobium ruizarguesonis]